MEEIYITPFQLNDFKTNKLLGLGKEGECYFLTEDTLIKIYYENKRLQDISFTDKKSPYIAFPKKVYKDKETKKVLAITVPFLPGQKLNNGFFKDMNINKLIEAYQVLNQELNKFPDIFMEDMCLDNILYDDVSNRFYIIDTGLWHQETDAIVLNQYLIDLNLSSALTRSLNWLKDYPDLYTENPKLYNLYLYTRLYKYVNFLEYLKLLKDFVLEKNGLNPETLSDLEVKNSKKY